MSIYHPYLARWDDASSIVELLGILRGLFSKEPPAVARPIPHRLLVQPPPIPHKPPELSAQRVQLHSPRPPPRSPKPSSAGPAAEETVVPAIPKAAPHDLRVGPPPLPSGTADLQERQFLVSRPVSQLPQLQPPCIKHGQPLQQLGKEPPLPLFAHQQLPHQHPAPEHPPASTRCSIVSPVGPVPMPVTTVSKSKESPGDLLTDPFDIDPLESRETANAAPPPLPPKPQKCALLNTLSETLAKQLQANISQNTSRLDLLSSRADFMRTVCIALQDEIARVADLHDVINSNVEILKEGHAKADEVIQDAKGNPPSNTPPAVTSAATTVPHPGVMQASPSVSSPVLATGSPVPGSRPLPSIDETLVPPTVVHKQLHDLAIQERAIQRALYALREALTKGRVGVDEWAKATRSLAREALLKKALAVKAAEGAGLDLE
ncbi:hypothetical protein KEM55_003126 [Ascosphaera atra]|nr:hypothetical protein KEM55_003126 [Ascosphaera atra]